MDFLNCVKVPFVFLGQYTIFLLTAVLFWVIFLPFWLLLKTIRGLVSLAYGRKYTLASHWESIFGYRAPNFHPRIDVYAVLEGQCPSLEAFRSKFQKILDSDPALRKLRFVCGPKYGFDAWTQPSTFDVEAHINELRDTRTITPEAMVEVMEELLEIELGGSDKPYWDIWLVRKFQALTEGTNCYAIIIRMHHVYSDAISLGLLLESRLRVSEPLVYTIDPRKPQPGLTRSILCLSYLKCIIQGPLCFFAMTIWPLIFDNSPFRVRDYAKRKWYARGRETLELSKLKTLKKGSGTSVIALLLSAISTALAKSRIGINGVGRDCLIIQAVFAMLPYDGQSLSNQFSPLTLRVPFRPKASPLTILKETFEKYRYGMTGVLPLFTYYFMYPWGDLPSVVKTFLWRNVVRSSPFILSNIPGPLNEWRLKNSRIVDGCGWVPLFNGSGAEI
jgi:hypothetical protein